MRRIAEIISSSFRMALQELWKNKLRTFLSLFGVTIGIFCIIGVLAAVNSLKLNIQRELKELGSNTIYLDKWDYAAGNNGEYPFWKYAQRPVPKYRELKAIKERTPTAKHVAFKIQVNDNVEAGDRSLANVNLYGITEEFSDIQPFVIAYGRYLTESEFASGSNSVVIGNEVAEKLFGDAANALDKWITLRGKKALIIGVIKKQGNQIVGGWQFDKSLIMPYQFARTMMDELHADPLILVQGADNVNSKVLQEDLRGAMRSIRKLSPTQDDNFALNDINDLSKMMDKAFASINIGGWAIGALAFIVGIFGVANIMFVTVKERTSQIGLKKAIGAKRYTILSEFLLESAFLCIIGGLIGLLLIFILTQIATALLHFPIFLSFSVIMTAILICVVAGVLAGIIPASQAARMDPVVAIRSK